MPAWSVTLPWYVEAEMWAPFLQKRNGIQEIIRIPIIGELDSHHFHQL
jgi:hypothetical protein